MIKKYTVASWIIVRRRRDILKPINPDFAAKKTITRKARKSVVVLRSKDRVLGKKSGP